MPTADDSFVAAYAQHLPAVSAYLARRVDRSFVEDLAADVFAVAWRKRELVVTGEELPWLYRIAANLVANHRRKQAATAGFIAGLRPADSAPSAEDIVIADESLARAWRALKPRDREILALSAFEDLSVPAMATALSISQNAVSIRLHRAKKNLAAQLAEPIDVKTERTSPQPT